MIKRGVSRSSVEIEKKRIPNQKTLLQLFGSPEKGIDKQHADRIVSPAERMVRYNGFGFVECPVCMQQVQNYMLNLHLDRNCAAETMAKSTRAITTISFPKIDAKESGHITHALSEQKMKSQLMHNAESKSQQVCNIVERLNVHQDVLHQDVLHQDVVHQDATNPDVTDPNTVDLDAERIALLDELLGYSAEGREVSMPPKNETSDQPLNEESQLVSQKWPIFFASQRKKEETLKSNPNETRECPKCGEQVAEYRFSQHVHQFCRAENNQLYLLNPRYALCDAKSTFYGSLGLHGIRVIYDFISKEEETMLIAHLDANFWKPSFANGVQRSQSYGYAWDRRNKVAMKDNFRPLPDFLNFIFQRMHDSVIELREFHANNTNFNEYLKEKGHSIGLHCDDRQISGDFVVTMSLCGDAFMTFQNERNPSWMTKVLLPQRSLLVTSGDGRYNW
eukprot:TRINITY_DN4072_c0_g1_i4.p1 TRINITY_DN4072_c0_g1~~TRINITY_DN4072_c0_g1_i4.p1  ORF type:complete len:449 (-),score=98.37 TRINITY_DN4072_c0_g1_i4:645-1991(-)